MTEKNSRSPLPEEVKKFREKISVDPERTIIDMGNNEKKIQPLSTETRTDTCNFIGAMMEVQEGGKITRAEWDNKDIYIVKKDGFLLLHKDDNKFYQWIISTVDMDAEDWVVII